MRKRKVDWDATATAADNARTRLPALTQRFFRAGRKLASAPLSAATSHRFRLDTKAFRYTLELFRPCYGPGLELRLASLRRIQDCLGAMSDYATTLDLVEAKLSKSAPERVRLERLLGARSSRKAAEFRRYWLETFDRSGQEQLWLNYLSRPRRS